MIPLYEIPNETNIDVRHLNLSYASTDESIERLKFRHLDGSIGICTDKYGNIIHLPANTGVKVVSALDK